jgi:hypothetical protein
MTIRLRATMAAAVTIALSCVLSGTARASTAAPAMAGAWYIASAPVIAATESRRHPHPSDTYPAPRRQTLGHAKSSFTSDEYTSVIPEVHQAAAEAVAAIVPRNRAAHGDDDERRGLRRPPRPPARPDGYQR